MKAITPPNEASPVRRGRTSQRLENLKTVLITTLAFWLLMAVGLLIFTAGSREPTTHTLVIPEGSIELIAAGENPLEIPSTWSLLADDTLVLVNEDRVDHWLGDFWVAANSTTEYELQPDFGGSILCSLHPDGEINLDIGLRDFDWRVLVLPTVIIGPFLGWLLVGIRRVMRLLDEPDTRPSANSNL